MKGGHGGNTSALAQKLGCEPLEILDFSSNINPMGTMPDIIPHLAASLQTIVSLPEVDNHTLIRQFSTYHGIPADCTLAGSGTTEFIYALPRAVAMKTPLIVAPTYADYADGCTSSGIMPEWMFATADTDFRLDMAALEKQLQGHDAVFLCNPNNPTGHLVEGRELHAFCKKHSNVNFIVDESYLPFAPSPKKHSLLQTGLPNVIVLHSYSKIFGIPGLRTGFIVADPGLIQRLSTYQLPWGVNTLAQKAAAFLLEHKKEAENFARKTVEYLESEREELVARLAAIPGLTCYPSATSFVLIRLPRGITASSVCDKLEKERLLIRNCSNFKGLDDRFIRIALKLPQANQQIANALKKSIADLQDESHR